MVTPRAPQPKRTAGRPPSARPSPPAPAVLRLSVHAVPGAKTTQAAGPHGDALKVRVAAPSTGGAANAALQRFLALTLGLPPSAVELLSGDTQRRKTFALHCPDEPARQRTQAQVAALMAPQVAACVKK